MTGANSCLSILPSDVLMGRREPSGCKRRKGWGTIAVCWGFRQSIFTTLATGIWPSQVGQSVSASTVTSQSYSVNSLITAVFSSSVYCNPGHSALHSPCMVQIQLMFFLFCYFIHCCSECWVPAIIHM